jgi:catechol 2,3-dioxygenase-like lactoylglutathione lyase family enzyme
VADFPVTRAGAILAVSDFGASLRFYRDQLGLTEVARYDDPPYATLTAAGARISLAEQGHRAPDRPGVAMAAPSDPASANVVLVLEVPDADVARKALTTLIPNLG